MAILISGSQPPLLFEMAPPLFGIGLIGVSRATVGPSRRRLAIGGFAALATIAGLAALATQLVGDVWGPALAASSLALMVGLLSVPRRGPLPAPMAWGIGVTMIPALVVGGALYQIDERLLELPLIGLGLAWVVVGWAELKSSDVDLAT